MTRATIKYLGQHVGPYAGAFVAAALLALALAGCGNKPDT